jgi:dTDP-4-amino-4,6-dideoxygalactose transaminase
VLRCGGVNGLPYFRVMYRIPFFSLNRQHQSINSELKESFDKVIKNGRFILDQEVKYFEEEFATHQKMKYCVTVGNGHDAILISLKALGIGHGDEVIVPSHTCHATWLAVINAGAKPVPVEVDPSTYNINPLLIENSITKKTKVILPVHLYGHPCAMDKIMMIARKNKLFVVEDNAQAHGAMIKNKLTGSWGQCNATSFYPTKNLGALGDGGAIVTNDKETFLFARAFSNYGSEKKDINSMRGINSRLDELQASVLRIKLKRLNQWNQRRRKNANKYFDSLKNVGDVWLPPKENETEKPVYHQFVIQTKYRDKLKKYLEQRRIETAIHYPTPIHLQKAYVQLGYRRGSLPMAEKLSKTVLSLPIFPGLMESEINIISSSIKNFFK